MWGKSIIIPFKICFEYITLLFIATPAQISLMWFPSLKNSGNSARGRRQKERGVHCCCLFSVYPITSKFYAKSEEHAPQAAQRYRHNNNNNTLSSGHPLLESQMYGWIPLQCQKASGYLNCVHAPKRRCRMTIHGEHIIAGRITERPPFNGLKFILH